MVATTKILFFASNPDNTERLNLGGEVRAITEKIRASERRDVLDLIASWAVRPDDLIQELSTHKPTIVHFSGHSNQFGELVLSNELNQDKPVSPSALTKLFSDFKDNIRLVVLLACYSKAQAESIVQTIDCVVGMNTSIGDKAAIVFAGSFYRAMGFGLSVKDAFEQGIRSLELEGLEKVNTPELLVRQGIDASSLFLVSDLVERICGDWWGKVTTKGHESVLACIRIKRDKETGRAALDGRSFSSDGKLVAKWNSLFSDVTFNSRSNHIEFKYLYEGKRNDKLELELLFGRADVTFEVPANPREAIQRGESIFVGVYKSAAPTEEKWGNATQRSQLWARAKDTSEFEALFTPVSPEQSKPIVEKILSAVWKMK